MNSSFYSLDRTTHLKVAVLSLFAAVVVAAVTIGLHVSTASAERSVSRFAAPAEDSFLAPHPGRGDRSIVRAFA